MKIIFISELAAGGVERVNYLLAKGLSKRHDVSILSVKGIGKDYVSDVPIFVLNKTSGKVAILDMIRVLRREKPDWIITCEHTGTLCAEIYKYLFNKKSHVMFVLHSVYSSIFRYNTKKKLLLQHYLPKAFGLYNHCDLIIYVSDGVKKDFTNCFKITKPSQKVIYNPVFENMPCNQKHDFNINNKVKLVSVGRLSHEKRQNLLIEALRILRSKGLNYDLFLYGEGNLKNELEEQAKLLNIHEYVHFMGFRIDVIEELYKYDIFCLASEFESFGNVIVEAMGAKVPVVSVDCPYGPREILGNGEFGSLTSDIPNDIAQAILDICTNDDIQSIIEKAYKKSQCFLLKEIETKYEEAMASIN